MTESSLILAYVIVFVILIVHIYFQNYFDHVDALFWENKKLYTMLLATYGMPSILNPEKGGGAIWRIDRQKLSYFDQKYEKEAEPSIHLWTPINLFPLINTDTVRVSEKGRQQRIADVIGLMPQYMAYDPVKKQLLTRFHHLGVTKILTMLAQKITTGELTLEEIKKNKLLSTHVKQISSNMPEYDATMESKIDKYIEQYVSCFC